MTIDKAIKKLEDLERYAYEPETQKAHEALQLGIEALERIKSMRHDNITDAIFYLPGETED